ncbi:MAG: hypothetical protein ABFD97_19095 [Syntrophobacter sp.]
MNDRFMLIFEIIEKLNRSKIYYSIRASREDAISIDVAVPGQRWEIDLIKDGSIDVEIFKSDGNIYDESKLNELFDRFSD